MSGERKALSPKLGDCLGVVCRGQCPREMLRRYWRDPHFWRWLWRDRASPEVKAVICVLVAALVLGGGWFAADRLAGANAASTSAGQVTLATTVERVVTVHRNGRVI